MSTSTTRKPGIFSAISAICGAICTLAVRSEEFIDEAGSMAVSAARTGRKQMEGLEAELDLDLGHKLALLKLEHEKELPSK